MSETDNNQGLIIVGVYCKKEDVTFDEKLKDITHSSPLCGAAAKH